MNMEETDALVDPSLLNLPEDVFATPPQLLRHLYDSWISLPNSTKLVNALIEYYVDKNIGAVPTNSGNSGAVENKVVLNAISRAIGNTNPRSIAESSTAGTSKTNLDSGLKSSSIEKEEVKNEEVIPQFYFPRGHPPTSEFVVEFLNKIDSLFNTKILGLDKTEFSEVTKEVCGLPFFLSSALFNKITMDGSLNVTRDAFVRYWVHGNMLTLDKATQIFNILKQPDRNYLTQSDFLTVLEELIAFHPGLNFLKGTPEFQEYYSSTVIYRIFYYINRSQNDRITLRELKRSDLVAAMQSADKEADINLVLRYFSYQHFAVIYWKFVDLDEDVDLHISRPELSTYNNHGISSRILDRIFSQVPRRFKSKTEEMMCYEDFVYFLLADEDKQCEPSLEYWFRCIDLDGNGILTYDELRYFYEEQNDRMTYIDEEEDVPFELMLTRLLDTVPPKGKDGITWHDVKASKLAGDFFNVLCNFRKFATPRWPTQRQRLIDEEILAEKEQVRRDITEWDMFALREFRKLDEEISARRGEASGSGRTEKASGSGGTELNSGTGLDSLDDAVKPKKKQKALRITP